MRRTAAGLLMTLAALLVLGAPAAHAADRATVRWQADADIDLHVYDAEGHHAFYDQPGAIPRALLSGDSLHAGSESFTDEDVTSPRRFGYEVCLFPGGATDVPVSMTWVDEQGTTHEESFTLA